MTDIPKGIVAALFNVNGHNIVSVSDFNTTCYGGFSVYESQKHRVQIALAEATVRAYCSEDIVDAILKLGHSADIVRRLVDKGFTLSIIPIGH